MNDRYNDFSIITDHSIAKESPDHLFPAGTKNDNSRNLEFNRLLYGLFPHQTLFVLDIGCAGGAFVESLLHDWYFAVGLEGSNYSQKNNRASWSNIPNNLFTCDVTKPFQLLFNNGTIKFDVITTWEFMEHIKESDLPQLFANFKNHLKPGGLFITSTALFPEGPRHQTVKSREWWIRLLNKNKFSINHDITNHFGLEYIRGTRADYDPMDIPVRCGGKVLSQQHRDNMSLVGAFNYEPSNKDI